MTRHKEQAKRLYENLQEEADYVFLLYGNNTDKVNKEIREKIKLVPRDRSMLLIATGQKIGEGFDCPRLDTLMLAAPVSFPGRLEQYVGRLNRDYPEKKEVIVYDYIDSHMYYFNKMYVKRLRTYKKIGFDILNKETLKVYKQNKRLPSYKKIKKIDDRYEIYDNKSGKIYLSSGGTSGKPKTIVLSDFSILSLIDVAPEVLGENIKKEVQSKFMLACLPMFHGFGLVMGILTLMLHGGADSILPKFRSQKVVDLIEKNKCNIIIGVPAMFEALLKNKNFYGEKLKNIDICFIGGDFIPPSLLQRFNKRLEENGSKAKVFEGYGLTETVTVMSVNTFENNCLGSVGKPINNVKVKILDDDHNVLNCFEKGEIAISGPTLMNGYLEGESNFIEIDKERYVLSGDIGYLDDEGFLFFVSRKKRIIKKKGYNIFPLEIEKYISSLDEVENCSYLSKNGNAEEETYLFLEIKSQEQENIKNKVIELIRKNGQEYEVPDHVIFIDKFPKTPVGKVDYPKLLEKIN